MKGLDLLKVLPNDVVRSIQETVYSMELDEIEYFGFHCDVDLELHMLRASYNARLGMRDDMIKEFRKNRRALIRHNGGMKNVYGKNWYEVFIN